MLPAFDRQRAHLVMDSTFRMIKGSSAGFEIFAFKTEQFREKAMFRVSLKDNLVNSGFRLLVPNATTPSQTCNFSIISDLLPSLSSTRHLRGVVGAAAGGKSGHSRILFLTS